MNAAAMTPAEFLPAATRAINALQGIRAKSAGTTLHGIECSALRNAQGRLNMVLIAEGDEMVSFMREVARLQNGICRKSATVEITTPADDADLDVTEILVRIDISTVCERFER